MTHDLVALVLATKDRLVDAGAGTWSLTGTYPAEATAITIKTAPAAPDRNIALTVYDDDQDPDPAIHSATVYIQAHLRGAKGNTLDVDALAAAVDGALACHHTDWSGITVTRCRRISLAPLGPDENGRHEMTANYELLLP